MTETTFECEECGKDFYGSLYTTNAVIDENKYTVGCSDPKEGLQAVPTLCYACGAEQYILFWTEE